MVVQCRLKQRDCSWTKDCAVYLRLAFFVLRNVKSRESRGCSAAIPTTLQREQRLGKARTSLQESDRD